MSLENQSALKENAIVAAPDIETLKENNTYTKKLLAKTLSWLEPKLGPKKYLRLVRFIRVARVLGVGRILKVGSVLGVSLMGGVTMFSADGLVHISEMSIFSGSKQTIYNISGTMGFKRAEIDDALLSAAPKGGTLLAFAVKNLTDKNPVGRCDIQAALNGVLLDNNKLKQVEDKNDDSVHYNCTYSYEANPKDLNLMVGANMLNVTYKGITLPVQEIKVIESTFNEMKKPIRRAVVKSKQEKKDDDSSLLPAALIGLGAGLLLGR